MDGWMGFLRSRRVVDRCTGTGLTGDIFIMILFSFWKRLQMEADLAFYSS